MVGENPYMAHPDSLLPIADLCTLRPLFHTPCEQTLV